ncbi:MAG TPA: hypothetical protein DCG57_07150, partial [Candidatus Riflebacteria bacterium]|nr:hypothetical protein [Candidatus Riflebacteria bacterium]
HSQRNPHFDCRRNSLNTNSLSVYFCFCLFRQNCSLIAQTALALSVRETLYRAESAPVQHLKTWHVKCIVLFVRIFMKGGVL